MIHPNIIFMLHTMLVIYMIVYPIVTVNSKDLLVHSFLLCSIMLHWLLNSDVCALTELEFWCRKLTTSGCEVRRNQTFFGSIISPVYKLSNVEVYKATIILMLFTIHKASLYHIMP